MAFDGALFLFGVTQPQFYIMTTLLSEYILLFLEYCFIRKNELVNLKKVLLSFAKYSGIVLGFVPLALLVNYIIPTNMIVNARFITNIVATVIVCSVYYGIVLIAIKDEEFMEILEKGTYDC